MKFTHDYYFPSRSASQKQLDNLQLEVCYVFKFRIPQGTSIQVIQNFKLNTTPIQDLIEHYSETLTLDLIELMDLRMAGIKSVFEQYLYTEFVSARTIDIT